jgi:hypothetical protein
MRSPKTHVRPRSPQPPARTASAMARPPFSFAGLGSSLGQRRHLRQCEGASSTELAGSASSWRRHDIVRVSRAWAARGKLARDMVVEQLGCAQAATEPGQVLDGALPPGRWDRPARSRRCRWCRGGRVPPAPVPREPRRPCQCHPHVASCPSHRNPCPRTARLRRPGTRAGTLRGQRPAGRGKVLGPCLSIRETASATRRPQRRLPCALSGLSRQACGLLRLQARAPHHRSPV